MAITTQYAITGKSIARRRARERNGFIGVSKSSNLALLCFAQVVASHFFRVTHIKLPVCDDRMIPTFAFDSFKLGALFELVGFCRDERDLAAFLGQDQQQLVILEKDHLPT